MAETLSHRVGDTTKGQLVQVSELPVAKNIPVSVAYSEHEAITVSTTALGLTAPLTLTFDYAFITIETDKVRFRMDGIPPTATTGHELNAGDVLELDSQLELRQFLAIRSGAADATARVSYGTRL